jgi:threonine dehydratase
MAPILWSSAIAALTPIWVCKSGAMPIHAFDQDETKLGQGTIGAEPGEQAADIATPVVSVGGGDLIAGIAAWYARRVKVVGVEPIASPTLTKALEFGQPIDPETGCRGGFACATPDRDRVFPIVQAHGATLPALGRCSRRLSGYTGRNANVVAAKVDLAHC